MARWGLMAALRPELAAVLDLMPDERRQVLAGREYWAGHWHGHELVAVLSGVGKVAAATTATGLIERFGVDRVVFTGVAGGLAEGVAVGDVVVAHELLQHDLDASPLFPRYEVPLTGRSHFPADLALSHALLEAARRVLINPANILSDDALREFHLHAPKVHHGLIVSGDRFVSSGAESTQLRHDLPDALAVEMEGAAVAQVCHDYGLPFAAIRTISDRADDAAHVDFSRFVEKVASPYSIAILEATLQGFSNDAGVP